MGTELGLNEYPELNAQEAIVGFVDYLCGVEEFTIGANGDRSVLSKHAALFTKVNNLSYCRVEFNDLVVKPKGIHEPPDVPSVVDPVVIPDRALHETVPTIATNTTLEDPPVVEKPNDEGETLDQGGHFA